MGWVVWLTTGVFVRQVYPHYTDNTELLLLIGAIYYQLGEYEQCIAFNDRCILLDPHMAEAHANLANGLQQLGILTWLSSTTRHVNML